MRERGRTRNIPNVLGKIDALVKQLTRCCSCKLAQWYSHFFCKFHMRLPLDKFKTVVIKSTENLKTAADIQTRNNHYLITHLKNILVLE